MKIKHANIQKSYAFADPIYIFSENSSLLFSDIFHDFYIYFNRKIKPIIILDIRSLKNCS